MNFTPVTGWYYIDANNRTASWTGVSYFYDFMTANDSAGPFAIEVSKDQVLPGDVVQLGRSDGTFYHSLLILAKTANELYLAAHDNDALYRPLSDYQYRKSRFLHIIAARS